MADDCGCGCETAAPKGLPTKPADCESAAPKGLLTKPADYTSVGPDLTLGDRLGAARVRLGINRDAYTVDPGLYALGKPGRQSPVLVSANYKLSFDTLRSALPGRDVWILVLDTFGVNVWCAAGKGTFGTDEIVARVEAVGLSRVVAHRKLIVPQLGAPGVAAHEVKKRSGFRVLYGPVRADDLGAYLDADNEATPEMRRKRFPLGERAVLIPVELFPAAQRIVRIVIGVLVVAGLLAPGPFFPAMESGVPMVLALAVALLGGAALVPLLLPWLPGRPFSVKGVWVGLVLAVVLVALQPHPLASWPGRLDAVAWLLVVPALSSHLAALFTGASTYTSPSGVRRELRFAIPIQAAAGVLGTAAWVAARALS